MFEQFLHQLLTDSRGVDLKVILNLVINEPLRTHMGSMNFTTKMTNTVMKNSWN